jgi:hypothetical protein
MIAKNINVWLFKKVGIGLANEMRADSSACDAMKQQKHDWTPLPGLTTSSTSSDCMFVVKLVLSRSSKLYHFALTLSISVASTMIKYPPTVHIEALNHNSGTLVYSIYFNYKGIR